MPDRELRHLHRTELVEIIFALKQSEDQLKAENAALTAQLQDRRIHIQNAGSIAQAALELNKVFEAAQAAAEDYLASVQAEASTAGADAILAQARAQAEALKQQTEAECRAMTAEAQRQRARTEAECQAMLDRAKQEVQARWAEFDRRACEVLDHYQKTDFLPEERHTT